MPCYLFTYHSYQSWMPDRDEGFKRRDEVGVLAPNRALANVYRAQATESPAWLATSAQWEIVDELLIAREKQAFRLHYAATNRLMCMRSSVGTVMPLGSNSVAAFERQLRGD